MSSYLAFDREALAMLRLALTQATDELSTIVGRDFAAATARTHLQRATSITDSWAPLLAGLGSCTALELYRPVGLDSSDLFQAFWAQLSGDRVIVSDPVVGPHGVDELARAAALGDAIRTGRIERFLSPDEQRWLRKELDEITQSKAASAAFMHAIGPRTFVELARRISEPVQADPSIALDQRPGVVPDVLATLDALGRVLGQFRAGEPGRAQAAWSGPTLDEMGHFALVRMVRAGIEIEGAWLDKTVIDIAARALDGLEPRFSLDPFDHALGSEVVWLLSGRPTAAQTFLEDAERILVEDVVLHYDSEARMAMLLASSDPSIFHPDEVRESVQRVIDVFLNPEFETAQDGTTALGSGYLPDGTGNYFSRYLPELLGVADLREALGQPVATWSGTGQAERDESRLVQFLGLDPRVLDHFDRIADQMFQAALTTADTEHIKRATFAIAALIDVRNFLLINEFEETRGVADLAIGFAGMVPGPGWLIGIADLAGVGDVVMDAAGTNIRQAIARNEFGEIGVQIIVSWAAIGSFARQNGLPQPPPLAVPSADDAKAGDNGTRAFDRFDEAIDEWMGGLTAADQAKITALKDGVDSATARGFRYVTG